MHPQRATLYNRLIYVLHLAQDGGQNVAQIHSLSQLLGVQQQVQDKSQHVPVRVLHMTAYIGLARTIHTPYMTV